MSPLTTNTHPHLNLTQFQSAGAAASQQNEQTGYQQQPNNLPTFGNDAAALNAHQQKTGFDHFADFMNIGLVRYLGYANEAAAATASSFFPEKNLDPNKWYTKGNPGWFKALNATTWAYAGLDVVAKAGEAYKKARDDGDKATNPITAWVKTAFDRAIFQIAATIVIPVKVIHMLQHGMDAALSGKMTPKSLRTLKFVTSMGLVPVIAAFVDGGTNLVLDKTLRPLLGLPKHIVETHGKPLDHVLEEQHADGNDEALAEDLPAVSAIGYEQRFQPSMSFNPQQGYTNMPMATFSPVGATTAAPNPFAATESNYPVAQYKYQQFAN